MPSATLVRGEAPMTTDHQRTDQALVAGCLADDPAALTALVERYQAEVFGVCLRLTHEPEAALELANTTFFKAYQHLDRYDPTRPLRPWLLRIATNESLNYLRGRRRDREHTVAGPDGEELTARLPGPDDPAADALDEEQRAGVRAAVAALPLPYRLMIVLRFFHDLSYAEIAEQTGLPINTIGVQLSRARALLRRALSGHQEARHDPS